MRRGGTLSTPSPTSQNRDPGARIAHAFSEQLASVRRFGQSSRGWHACQFYKITSSKTPNQAIAKQHTPTSRDAVDSTGKLMKLLNFPPRADLHLILPRNTRREGCCRVFRPHPGSGHDPWYGMLPGNTRLLPPAAAAALQQTPCRPLSTML